MHHVSAQGGNLYGMCLFLEDMVTSSIRIDDKSVGDCIAGLAVTVLGSRMANCRRSG